LLNIYTPQALQIFLHMLMLVSTGVGGIPLNREYLFVGFVLPCVCFSCFAATDAASGSTN
jgi:hypothetical protein